MSLPTQAGQSTSQLTRYVVESSDVLEGELIVNVKEENSDKVIWFKERFLEDEEIVEHLVHKESGKIRWTMHRPRNGWYIRIRAPSFPPGAFIPLIPPGPGSPHPSGALLFSSRTNVIPGAQEASARPSTSTVHSYPPSPPPAVVVHPPTPAAVQARLDQVQGKQRHQVPTTQITPFVLAPYVAEVLKPEQMTYFQRALSIIKTTSAGPSYSFTLARVAPPSPLPSPALLQGPASPVSPLADATATASPEPPLLSFHDRTPLMMVRSVTGLVEVNQPEEQALGVESSFWIAVALTYLEFLQEKESYLAALSD